MVLTLDMRKKERNSRQFELKSAKTFRKGLIKVVVKGETGVDDTREGVE